MTASELWSRILKVVQAGLPEQAYRTWLAGTSAAALSEGELLVEAPSLFHVEWLEDKYGPVLQDAAQKVLGRPISISFLAVEGGNAPVPTIELITTPQDEVPTQAPPSAPPQVSPGLNHRYTFQRFVVG
ncbi:MAG: DnaA N-terminal domain-containing protein, partial [Gemmatimonadota bacterium]